MRDCRRPELERLSREFATRDERHGRQGLRRQAADCQSELEEVRRVLNRQSVESQKELARLAERVRQAEQECDRYKDELAEALEKLRAERFVGKVRANVEKR